MEAEEVLLQKVLRELEDANGWLQDIIRGIEDLTRAVKDR